MRCKFPYNENFMVFAEKHAGGNGNLIINFAWPNLALAYAHSNNNRIFQYISSIKGHCRGMNTE